MALVFQVQRIPFHSRASRPLWKCARVKWWHCWALRAGLKRRSEPSNPELFEASRRHLAQVATLLAQVAFCERVFRRKIIKIAVKKTISVFDTHMPPLCHSLEI